MLMVGRHRCKIGTLNQVTINLMSAFYVHLPVLLLFMAVCLSLFLSSPPLEVVVLDADDLAADPPAALNTLCDALGISFEASMLTWPAGPKACDGIWASHWCVFCA